MGSRIPFSNVRDTKSTELLKCIKEERKLPPKRQEAGDKMLGKKKIPIVFEDDSVLVCEKPAGMPVQPDTSGNVDV